MNEVKRNIQSAVNSDTTDSADEMASAIGARLRSIRAERGLTILQLAQKADLSAGLLSQIERGKSNPSVRTLQRLKSALGVNLWSLLQDERPLDRTVSAGAQPGGVTEVDYIRRKDNRLKLVVGESRLVKELLSPRSDSSLLFMVITLPPGGQSEDIVIGRGEKAGVVIEGRLLLTIGEASFELNQGDSFQFPSNEMHGIRSLGNEPTKVLWIMSVVESRI